MKCSLCNSPVEVVNHPGIGKLVHHGGGGCRNTGAHSQAAWQVMCGEPVENVAMSMTAEEIAADPEIVLPDPPKKAKKDAQ